MLAVIFNFAGFGLGGFVWVTWPMDAAGETANFVALVGIYAVAAPTFSLGPLWVIHLRMKSVRYHRLEIISEAFQVLYERSNQRVKTGWSGPDYDIDAMKRLQELHSTTRSSTVWPIDLSYSEALSVIYSAPLVAIAPVVLKKLF